MNYALHVSIEVHMDDLRGFGPRLALDLVRINFSQDESFQCFGTVYEMGMRYEHLKRERCLQEDRTEIVAQPKVLEGSVAQHEIDKFQSGTNTDCSWIRQVEA